MSDTTVPVPQTIPSRQKVLDDLRGLREQVSTEAEVVAKRIAADTNYQQWLLDYGSALDSAIYNLTPPVVVGQAK